MRYFRKLKPSAETSATTPTSPEELRKFVAQRDSKALAASSAAIALSIGSAFSDIRGTSTDGGTVQGMDAVGQTVYAAIRMAVDITKESSDLCLPLKAVVGAISTLMKNYDVSAPCLRTEHALILLYFSL